jgi:hypothetical protein
MTDRGVGADVFVFFESKEGKEGCKGSLLVVLVFFDSKDCARSFGQSIVVHSRINVFVSS